MKLCVLFPGIGYTTEMPLMYYSGKTVLKLGYELIRLNYHDLPSDIRGNEEAKKKAFEIAVEQVMDQLKDVEWAKYDEVLFIGKSIGTVVAAFCGEKLGLNARYESGSDSGSGTVKYVYLTPLEETFLYTRSASGIAFHGNSDPWAETDKIVEKCAEYDIPLYIYEGANHSIETGDIIRDINSAKDVIEKIKNYIS